MKQDFIITGIDRVIMVGKEEYTEQMSSFPCTLKSHEVIFHFSGRSTVFFDDTALEIKPNTVRLLPKGVARRYDVVHQEHGECIDVFFQTDRPVSDMTFVIDASKNEGLRSLFQKIFARWVGKEEGYYFECISLLYKIFSEMQKKYYAPADHQRKIKPATDAIHNGFLHRKLTISGLAAMCDMSESYFKRLFKEKYGVSPKKYIIQLKLDYACDLLRLERYTVTQIAEVCNFSDVYLFSRQFKEHMGITPTQFVKKYRSSK